MKTSHYWRFWLVRLLHQTMTSLKMAIFTQSLPQHVAGHLAYLGLLPWTGMKKHSYLLLGAGHMTYDLVSLI